MYIKFRQINYNNETRQILLENIYNNRNQELLQAVPGSLEMVNKKNKKKIHVIKKWLNNIFIEATLILF